MDIFSAIVLQVLYWVFEFFGELILQIIFEVLAGLIGRSVKEALRRPAPVNAWLAAIGYMIFGAIAGAISLWLIPGGYIKEYWLRVTALLLTPIFAGLVMAWIGSWRRKHDKEIIRIETFAYGFFFAFAMAVMRFLFAG